MPDLALPDNFLATPDRFLFHAPTRTAILADLHLGVELELRKAGTLMPDFAAGPLRAAWQKIVARDPAHIILAGDVFHVPTPDDRTWQFALDLFSTAPTGCRLTLIPGNHDPAPAALADLLAGTPIAVAASASVGRWTVAHGHDLSSLSPRPNALIVGHQHPAVIFSNRVQSAKMICYAVALPARRSTRHPALILLPPFSPAPLGSNLLTASHWILDTPLPDPAHVRIAGIVCDQVLDFGPLADLA